MREEMKRKLLDYTFYEYYVLDMIRMNDFDFERFKSDYTYFLSDREGDVILEYATYHMFKWIKRLKIPINRDEVRGYILEKNGGSIDQ
jgi:hypothetical protein